MSYLWLCNLHYNPRMQSKLQQLMLGMMLFFIFMRIYYSAHIEETLSLIKYMANVKLGVSRVSGGLGQRYYDRQFRLKKTKNNKIKLSRSCSFFTLLQMCIKKSIIPKAVQHFIMMQLQRFLSFTKRSISRFNSK